MFIRAKLLISLSVFAVAVFFCVKNHVQKKPAKIPSPSFSGSVSQETLPVASAPSDGEMVRCDSWGTNTGEIWGYGDGLMFRGSPDDWKSGRPVFERWRGEPL